MTKINIADRLAFCYHGINHKKIPAQKFNVFEPKFTGRFYTRAYGTTRGVLNNLVATVLIY